MKLMWECIWLRSHAGHHVTDPAEILSTQSQKNSDPFQGAGLLTDNCGLGYSISSAIIHCKRVKNPSGFISLYTPDMKGKKNLSKQKVRA